MLAINCYSSNIKDHRLITDYHYKYNNEKV